MSPFAVEGSGIAVASTSMGVGGVISMLGLAPSPIPGGIDRIQDVRTEASIPKIKGVKKDHRGVRPWKKRAYRRHEESSWCDTLVVVL